MHQADTWKALATTILQNPLFKFFYLVAVLISLLTLIISFINRCPPLIFFFLEALVNGLMVIEVAARFIANRRRFWESFWNRIDAVLVVFCLFTLVLIIFGHHQCHIGESDPTKEVEILEQIILILRNGMSLSRSVSLIQRY